MAHLSLGHSSLVENLLKKSLNDPESQGGHYCVGGILWKAKGWITMLFGLLRE